MHCRRHSCTLLTAACASLCASLCAAQVLTIEVDASWGLLADPPMDPWNVSSVDQLLWFARRHGYVSYLKVPCRSRLARVGQFNSMDPAWSAWYHPLARARDAFWPTRYVAAGYAAIQDLLLVDESARAERPAGTFLVDHLERRGREECTRSRGTGARTPQALGDL
jgi:hypothetical protein